MLENESTLRLSAFLLVFLVVAIFEWVFPRRKLQLPKAKRWLQHLVLLVVNALLVRLFFPMAAVGAAILAQKQGWGLFNVWPLHPLVNTLLAVVLLDLAIYTQHILFHYIPWLWRIHRVHHADLDFDVTTGLRFHPVEILLSMLIKFAVIIALGAPAIAVLIFELILNTMSMFNHSNIHLSRTADKVLRSALVTPDMHRVHHSTISNEMNTNYGFCLSYWDRLFKTYKKQPTEGHQAMTIGLDYYQNERETNRLIGMLLLPLKKRHSQ